jgi:Domain of unknown function (DUF4331)
MHSSSKLAIASATALLPLLALASSHREAPNITRLPTMDGTDLYTFMSYEPGREGYVTLIADYYPFQDPYAGPNYFALDGEGRYVIHVDNTGDGYEDMQFDFDFTNKLGGPDNRGIKLPIGTQQVAVPLKNVGPISAGDSSALNFQETYRLGLVRVTSSGRERTQVTNAATNSETFTKPLDFVGTKTFNSGADYESYARQYVYDVKIPGCTQPGKVFVGQRKEPFAVNVGKIFDLVNLVPIEASAFPGGLTQDPSNNPLANKSITTFALEIHSSCLTGKGNGVIGAWTASFLPQVRVLANGPGFSQPEVVGGALTQVSRLGMPLVNEVVIGLPDKDRFNAAKPSEDARFLSYVTNPSLPALLDVLFRDPVNQTLGTDYANLAPSNLPRNDLVAAFLTGIKGVNQLKTVTPSEMQRLNTTIAAVPAASQKTLGALDGDLAGFPNGRRPGDDVTDIELRVAMGRLCYPLTVGGDEVDLGLCTPSDAPVGNVPFTDGAPVSAQEFDTRFPYLRTPIPGSANFPLVSNP